VLKQLVGRASASGMRAEIYSLLVLTETSLRRARGFRIGGFAMSAGRHRERQLDRHTIAGTHIHHDSQKNSASSRRLRQRMDLPFMRMSARTL
jgi:hypothetical protein